MQSESARNEAARGQQRNRELPINHEGHFYDAETHRWPSRARVLLVCSFVSQLTPAEQLEITKGGRFPSGREHKKRMGELYDKLHKDIVELIKAEDTALNTATHPLPTREAVIKVACKWTRVFLQQGSVFDAPPHVAGHLVRRNIEALTAIRDMLLEGYWKNGQQRLYRNLQDLQSRRRLAFDMRFNQTKLKTFPALWNQLTAAFPNLAMMHLRMKKKRNAPLTQVC